MAIAGKRDDDDNILAHLLPQTADAVSPFGFAEEDEEEVNYSGTDEDLQSADLPGRGGRTASLGGAAQEERSLPGVATERKHQPISWQQWQGPARPATQDAAASRSVGSNATDSGSERRRRQESADGPKESSRDGREHRSSRCSPAGSRGRESAREWRERVLREGAADKGAAAERPRSRERSRHRGERRAGQGSEDHEQAAAVSTSQSRAADLGDAAKREIRRERSNPALGPPGHREVEETREEAELRRARKKTSMWDVDKALPISSDDRAGLAGADAGMPRQRSRTPPGPPLLRSQPRAIDHPLSLRRARRSLSPPPRRYAIAVDQLGPPRRVGSPLPWERPPWPWRAGPGGRSSPRSWHPAERGRSPPRDWPPPPLYFGSPPPQLCDLDDWEPGRRPRPLEPLLPPPHHLARGPFDGSRSPVRDRRAVVPAPRWHPRDPSPARVYPSSPSFRRSGSLPRRSRREPGRSASPVLVDPRLRVKPRRVSAERGRGTPEEAATRRQRHSATSPAARRGSTETRPEPRAPAPRSSRLQIDSSKESAMPSRHMEASAGRPDKDGSSRVQEGDSKGKEASGASSGSRSAGKRADAGHEAAGASLAASKWKDGAEAERPRDSTAQQSSQDPPGGGAAYEQDLSGQRGREAASADAAALSDSVPSNSAAWPSPPGKGSDATDADRNSSKPIAPEAAATSEQSPSAAQPEAPGGADKVSSSAAVAAAAQGKAEERQSAQEPSAQQRSTAEQALPTSPSGRWGPYSATVEDPATRLPSSGNSAQPQREAQGRGDGFSKGAREPPEAKGSKAGATKHSERGGKDSSRQSAGKASAATNRREQKTSSGSTKRAREEARDSRRAEPSSRGRRLDGSAASGSDRDIARRSSHRSTNGKGHGVVRNVKPRVEELPPLPEMPGPPPLPATLHESSGAKSAPDEHCMEWMYLDPRGNTQGPCSIADFKKWLGSLRVQPNMRREYEEFLSCLVWKKDGATARTPLVKLLG